MMMISRLHWTVHLKPWPRKGNLKMMHGCVSGPFAKKSVAPPSLQLQEFSPPSQQFSVVEGERAVSAPRHLMQQLQEREAEKERQKRAKVSKPKVCNPEMHNASFHASFPRPSQRHAVHPNGPCFQQQWQSSLWLRTSVL